MTQEDMETEVSLMLDESQILQKEEIVRNSRLVRLEHVNVFEYTPKPINCMAYDPLSKKMAIARFDSESACIEIWNTVDNWFCEQTLSPLESIEAIVWFKSRLFCAGLTGDLVEFDLKTGKVQTSIPCNFGPIWCLAVNKKEGLIAAGTENGSIVFFEVLEAEVKYKNVISRRGKILSICWHEELNLVVTGGFEVMVWDVRACDVVQKISINVNKDTKIWAVAVTEDFTIITGDSSGSTTFCFGKPGHLSHLKRFQSHGADIHSISMNPRCDRVCVSGADGMVTFTSSVEAAFEVEGHEVNRYIDHKTWISSKKATHHINDVKAVEFVDDETVVTAGLDCQTIIYNLNKKKLRKVSYVQQKGLIHTARKARCLLLQYPKYLELWKVGDSNIDGAKRGDIIDLSKCEERLLRINSNSNIISSCVSANAKAVAFSNEMGTFVYWIKMSESEGETSVEAVQVTDPIGLTRLTSTHLLISPNCNVLASVSRSKKLTFVDLKSNMKNGAISKHKLPADTCIQDLKFHPKSSHLAVACSNHGVKLINVKSGELTCSLPKRESPVYSIDFHPSIDDKIVMSHMDASITEMLTSTHSYTKRSISWMTLWHQSLANHLSQNKVGTKFKVMYDLSTASTKGDKNISGSDKLICQHDSGFTIVDWTADLLKHPNKRKRGDEETTKMSRVIRFKHTKTLFHVDMLDEGSLVVVETNPYDLMASFAPTFKKHKYGT